MMKIKLRVAPEKKSSSIGDPISVSITRVNAAAPAHPRPDRHPPHGGPSGGARWDVDELERARRRGRSAAADGDVAEASTAVARQDGRPADADAGEAAADGARVGAELFEEVAVMDVWPPTSTVADQAVSEAPQRKRRRIRGKQTVDGWHARGGASKSPTGAAAVCGGSVASTASGGGCHGAAAALAQGDAEAVEGTTIDAADDEGPQHCGRHADNSAGHLGEESREDVSNDARATRRDVLLRFNVAGAEERMPVWDPGRRGCGAQRRGADPYNSVHDAVRARPSRSPTLSLHRGAWLHDREGQDPAARRGEQLPSWTPWRGRPPEPHG